MIRWAIRILVIIVTPVIWWFQVAQTPKGILVGVGCALLIILAEVIIERIPLDNLVVGSMGAVVGYIVSKVFDYWIYLMDRPALYDRIHKYSLLLDILLGYLFMVVFIRKKDEVDLLDRNIFVPS